MTVAELIATLLVLPQDALVVTYQDDGHLVALREPPKIGNCFRYDDPDIVFYGDADAEELGNGASPSFRCALIGVTDEI